MKRVAVLLLTFSLCLTSSLFADENVRAVQSKLKASGFYFGEVNGVASSDLSAALTRYQIRNGLQITGKLDEATSKALGVQASAVNSQPPSSETWRQLRKSDREARRKIDAPTRALVPAQNGDDSTFVLSRERLRDYIGAFVLAGLDPQVGAELEFFGDSVRYYDDGVIGREKIRRDLARYDARWPERRFWLAGEVQVEPQPDSRLRVTFPLRYELRNGSKHSSGQITKVLLLEVTGSDLQIVAVNEAKAR